jgi:glycosyltransferase involved in cell wall biosynthesis
VPFFSVIIPTYNRAGLLQRTLDAVLAQSFPDYEVIVVDDGSSDHTKTVVQSLADRAAVPVHYVHQSNRGPAAARNHGLRLARGVWIAFTDDDTVPQAHWLRAFADAIAEHPDWVGGEGMTVCPDPDPLGHWVENLRGGQYITANMTYRASTLREVGGLDERFPFPKCEDTELAWRCLGAGPIGFCPSALVLHPNREQSWLAGLRQARYELSEFHLYRKLGRDYRRFRRLPHPWPMLGLIYGLVPLLRAWRFREDFRKRPVQFAAFAALTLARPLAFAYFYVAGVVSAAVGMSSCNSRN